MQGYPPVKFLTVKGAYSLSLIKGKLGIIPLLAILLGAANAANFLLYTSSDQHISLLALLVGAVLLVYAAVFNRECKHLLLWQSLVMRGFSEQSHLSVQQFSSYCAHILFCDHNGLSCTCCHPCT